MGSLALGCFIYHAIWLQLDLTNKIARGGGGGGGRGGGRVVVEEGERER